MVDRARRRRIEQSYLDELALLVDDSGFAPSPQSVLIAVQALEQFSIALDSLAPKARDAFLLHYLDGETQPVVAERLGISVRMVQKHLAQALLRCHQALAD
ncbi:hypothetical protein BH09PSE5_BH09PSE5_18010 [soil metagenome]